MDPLPPAPDVDAWIRADDERWGEARAIVALHPSLDLGDVVHVLRCLKLTPSERLHRGRMRAGLRAQ